MEELAGVIEPIIEEAREFLLRMAGQSDRALVILAAARLDVGLERFLKRLMHHHPGGQDNLFDPDRPLGTFSAKIALAYRLGAIDGEFEHALQLVRKIRNDFAHQTERVSLTDPSCRCRVIEIARDVAQNKWWDEMYDTFLLPYKDAVDDTQVKFCAAVALMVITLEAATLSNESITVNQQGNLTWRPGG